MITFKKTFDYYATDNELGDYISFNGQMLWREILIHK